MGSTGAMQDSDLFLYSLFYMANLMDDGGRAPLLDVLQHIIHVRE